MLLFSKFFRLKGLPILSDSHIKIEGTGPISSLIITPLGDQDYTFYRCVATNILGIKEHGIELKKAYPPDVVQQVIHFDFAFIRYIIVLFIIIQLSFLYTL